MPKNIFVDVDGHILEPSDLWVKNLEPRYRHRAMRFERDENGLEYWVMDQKPNAFMSKGTSANRATIGKSQEWRKEHIFEKHDVSWEEGRAMSPAACDPHERVEMMDKEGIDKSILFPSILEWMGLIRDPGLASAYCRVYNDWIIQFCHQCPDRLYPAVLLPWSDISESLTEFRRTATIGPHSVMCPGSPPYDIPYGDAHWDSMWAEFQDQDLPVGLHPSSGGSGAATPLYPELDTPCWFNFVDTTDAMLSFLGFFQGGTFERFPDLKLVVLETGTLWMPYLLERMDEKYKILGFTTQMTMPPSRYFQRHCWIAMDPDDEFGPFAIKHLGADKVLWAYDYPHSDSSTEPIKNLKKTLKGLPVEDQRKVAGGNCLDLYKLW